MGTWPTPAPANGCAGRDGPSYSREPELRQIVQDKLEQDKLEQEWSPAQIAAHLRETYPNRPDWQLCHETIYQALDHGGKGA